MLRVINISKLLCCFVICLSSFVGAAQLPQTVQRSTELFPLSIIHINDFHARFEETNERSTDCKSGQKCIGGYARAVTVIKELQRIRNQTNPIFLNAGDNFQGTFWYTVGRWRVTSHFLNLLNADATTLGNHEFDHSIEGVVPFLETIQSPMIVANIDDSKEPTFQNKYKKSIVIDRYGRKVGVIGVIIHNTDELSHTGNLKFTDESKAVKAEAIKLRTEGVDIIIVLSHCGLDVDYQIAKQVGPDVDVIVGGHSHTFMYTGNNAPGPDFPRDQYPAVIKHSNGQKTLIVQASAYLKYVGDLTVYFDDRGHVDSWEGAPIFLDTNITPDEEVLKELQPWKEKIDKEGSRKIGYTRIPLLRSGCNSHECNIGNVFADAFVNYYATKLPTPEGHWTSAAIALVPVGGIRTALSKGDITFSDLITTMPFANTIDALDLQGKHLLEVLEYSVSKSWDPNNWNGAYMMQVSGLKVVYNVTRDVGERVVSVQVLSTKTKDTRYEPLDQLKTYRVLLPSFIVGGGDGFKIVPKYMENHEVGPVDIDMAINYFKSRPIFAVKNGRITVLI